MSGLWSRTLVYLGLREEDDEFYYEYPPDVVDERTGYDGRDPYEAVEQQGRLDPRDRVPVEPEAERRRGRRDQREERFGDEGTERVPAIEERRRGSRSDREEQAADSGRIAAIGSGNVRRLRPEEPPARATMATTVKVVHVANFDDCEVIGTRFRTNQPVLFDVRGVEKRIARRVLDFVTGMTFVAYGSARRVGESAYLVVPDGVTIPNEERRRLSDLGYDLAGVPSR